MPSALRGSYAVRHSPPCTAPAASSRHGVVGVWGAVRRSWTRSAAIRVLLVAGSKTSIPNRWAPA